jgi:hypothetical protein
MTCSGRERPHEPVRALGMPADPDLTDEQVRAAWLAIAAATHPDRPGGWDPARYAAASAAYGQLRTAWGRERGGAGLTADQPYVPAPAPALAVPPGAGIMRTVRLAPARIRHGRPVRLLLRAIIVAVLSLLVLRLVRGQPSGPAVVTGLITWFVLTARGDLAPPPGR